MKHTVFLKDGKLHIHVQIAPSVFYEDDGAFKKSYKSVSAAATWYMQMLRCHHQRISKPDNTRNYLNALHRAEIRVSRIFKKILENNNAV